MRIFATVAVALAVLSGCATTSRFSPQQQSEIARITQETEARMRRGEFATQEAFEVAWSERLSKAFEFRAEDYELFAARMDIARRFDRKEITKDQALFLIQMKRNEIAQRLAAERRARQDLAVNQLALGLAILGGAYSPPPQRQYAAPVAPPSICSSYVNGRYISTRCW